MGQPIVSSRLASDPASSADGSDLYLVVHASDVRCAVPTSAIAEVHQAVAVSPLPRAPEVVEGLVDVRGRILPVIGLRRRLGLPARQVEPSEVLVRIRTQQRQLLVRADGVGELVTVTPEAVMPPPAAGTVAAPVAGVVSTTDGLLLVTEVDDFLTSDEADSVESALREWHP